MYIRFLATVLFLWLLQFYRLFRMFDILKNPRYLYTNDKHLIELISSNRLNLIASSPNLQKKRSQRRPR